MKDIVITSLICATTIIIFSIYQYFDLVKTEYSYMKGYNIGVKNGIYIKEKEIELSQNLENSIKNLDKLN